MDRRNCCYLEDGKADGKPCEELAEWLIIGSETPAEHIDACTKHVGYLLDDSPYSTVSQITD